MLEKYLSTKPLYYDKIDYTRVPNIYEKIKGEFSSPKIIHLIGTNGKGTTGRFIASALYQLGFNVGHYTSPHILKFNERIWLNAQDSSDEALQNAHKKLQTILSKSDADSLSYFEYTTFLALIVFGDCDFVVMEAGLGGEHDATAVFDKELTIVTPIDFDHETFLGQTITQIATTKLNAIQNNAIIAKQKYSQVMEVANKLAKTKTLNLKTVDDILNKEDKKMIDTISANLGLVEYLKDNLALSISALKFLNLKIKESDFNNSKLFGRLSYYKPNIILDVGHNTLAATSILKALKSKKYILVYNSYKDKNYEKILNILKPLIKRVEIIDVDDDRIVKKENLQDAISKLNLKYKDFKKCDFDEDYLIFGSFSVVETFLKMQGR